MNDKQPVYRLNNSIFPVSLIGWEVWFKPPPQWRFCIVRRGWGRAYKLKLLSICRESAEQWKWKRTLWLFRACSHLAQRISMICRGTLRQLLIKEKSNEHQVSHCLHCSCELVVCCWLFIRQNPGIKTLRRWLHTKASSRMQEDGRPEDLSRIHI